MPETYQTVDGLDEYIKGRTEKFPKLRIYTLYKWARKKAQWSSMGDYIILWHVVRGLCPEKVQRRRVSKCMRLSPELKLYSGNNKKELIANLLGKI